MREPEDCLTLDMKDLVKLGVVLQGKRQRGRLQWYNHVLKMPIGTIDFAVDCCRLEASTAVFTYTLYETRKKIDLVVSLTTTRPNYGGLQWYFKCPIKNSVGARCGRRARKLFLPPGEERFGCRWCHGLTYQSHQRSSAALGILGALAARKGVDVEEIRELLKSRIELQRV